jgi:membrane fusion protein (multidrug efflux system)
MAEPVLKFPTGPAVKARETAKSLKSRLMARRRLLLLVVLPAIVAVVGLTFYLSGGRYVSTDNAYVGAQKVLITPSVSGTIKRVMVTEGQRVKAGDELFEIDPETYRLALQQAEARLESTKTDYANLRTNDGAMTRMIELAQKTVDLKRMDVERKSTLMANRTGSQFDLDGSSGAYVVAQTQVEQMTQQLQGIRNQLLGDPDLPLEKFPPYMQAKAALGQAESDLRNTMVRAPMNGTATQVDNIQLGRYVTTGTPVFSVIDDSHPWVDANPKETDFTYLAVGQRVDIVVDSFPNQTLSGTVSSLSPGTGAQFAILPAQNASGNWVKVVQRVPLRIMFDANQDTHNLRSGMSANVWIDTKRGRSLAGLLGLSAPAQETLQ